MQTNNCIHTHTCNQQQMATNPMPSDSELAAELSQRQHSQAKLLAPVKSNCSVIAAGGVHITRTNDWLPNRSTKTYFVVSLGFMCAFTLNLLVDLKYFLHFLQHPTHTYIYKFFASYKYLLFWYLSILFDHYENIYLRQISFFFLF